MRSCLFISEGTTESKRGAALLQPVAARTAPSILTAKAAAECRRLNRSPVSLDNEVVKCPICKKQVAKDDPDMPFCSERCRTIDLGNWASEKYVISKPLRDAGDTEIGADEEE